MEFVVSHLERNFALQFSLIVLFETSHLLSASFSQLPRTAVQNEGLDVVGGDRRTSRRVGLLFYNSLCSAICMCGALQSDKIRSEEVEWNHELDPDVICA